MTIVAVVVDVVVGVVVASIDIFVVIIDVADNSLAVVVISYVI
jgi:hypothetical protein